MSNIEPKIKKQYKKFFQRTDWVAFKQMAEHYLRVSAYLKKRDIKYTPHQLWMRNVQKRLFIGVGCELLLKAHYLRQGYGINVPEEGRWHLYQVQNVDPKDFREDRTFSMNFLIDQLKNGPKVGKMEVIERGLRIAKVFRNKEGHVTTYRHEYDAESYTRIEESLIAFYDEAFDEHLDFQISFEPHEAAVFSIQ